MAHNHLKYSLESLISLKKVINRPSTNNVKLNAQLPNRKTIRSESEDSLLQQLDYFEEMHADSFKLSPMVKHSK